jgi:phage baseplate assembly protein gpV
MLDTCASSTDPSPTGCSFSYDNSATFDTPTSVRWTITSYPTVSVDVASDGTLSLTTTSEGTAHISALSTDYAGTVTPVSQDATITISGTLNWDGGDPSTASVTLN